MKYIRVYLQEIEPSGVGEQIISRLGYDGYGRYCYLRNVLALYEGGILDLSAKRAEKLLALRLGMSKNKLHTLLNELSLIGAINEILWSQSKVVSIDNIKEQQKAYYKKVETMQSNLARRHEK